MDKEEIEAELASDNPAVREAVIRGILAAYGNWHEVEGEYSGHIRSIIVAIRSAVTPLV